MRDPLFDAANAFAVNAVGWAMTMVTMLVCKMKPYQLIVAFVLSDCIYTVHSVCVLVLITVPILCV